MKFTRYFLASALLFAAVVFANEAENDQDEVEVEEVDSNEAVENEVESQEGSQEGSQKLFNGDDAKFNRTINKLFDNFDQNGDDSITTIDLDNLFKVNSTGPLQDERVKIAKYVSAELQKFDANGDGAISRPELYDSLLPLKEIEVVKNMTLCRDAKEAKKVCRQEFKNSTVPDLGVREKVFETLCTSGGAAAMRYPVENCLINAQNCDEKIACYENAKPAENAVTLSKRSSVALQKRANAIQIMFWIGVAMLGLLSFTLITIPFLVVIIYVGMKIDWRQFD